MASINPVKVLNPVTLKSLVVVSPVTPNVDIVATPDTFKYYVDPIPEKVPFLAKSSS